MGYYRLGYALPAQTFTTLFSFDGTNGQALLVTTGPGGAACITGRDVRHRLPRYPPAADRNLLHRAEDSHLACPSAGVALAVRARPKDRSNLLLTQRPPVKSQFIDIALEVDIVVVPFHIGVMP